MSHFSVLYYGYIEKQLNSLRTKVAGMGDEMLLASVDDLVAQLVAESRIEVPTLHRDRMVRVDGGEAPGLPGSIRVVFAVPFDGQAGLFDFQPSPHTLTDFSGQVRGNELRLEITQNATATKESIEAELGKQLSLYELELFHLRANCQPFNDKLPSLAAELVATRRAQLLRTRDLLASLEVPVRRRTDAVIPVPVVRRVQVVTPAHKPSERFVPEPEVLKDDFEEILSATRSMGVVMERAPGTFADLAEEGIRDFFLPLLNASFQGASMAEVFNGEGKTDILIRVGEKNVFIAECKVWQGEAKFASEAVAQLLGNAGWRDTKCAILLFVHERSVSDIRDKADGVIRRHECYKREGPGAVSELERRYVLHWPGDPRRELQLVLQVFAVPTTTSPRVHRRSSQ
jgi:hypothetical protein